MTETPIPERVTNKDLFKLQIESIHARNAMEQRLTSEIGKVDKRVVKLESKYDDVEDIKDDLKKRDNFGYIGTIITAIFAGVGIWNK